jgi:hypothetical protein
MKQSINLLITACLCAIILFALLLPAHAENIEEINEADKKLQLQLSIGFNTFNLNEMKSFYEAGLEMHRLNGVPIPTGRKYPGNALIGLNGLYRLSSIINIGMGLRYTSSPAKSLYKDYSGELEVSGSVRMLTLEGIVQAQLKSAATIRPFVGVRGGLVFGFMKLAEIISSDSYPVLNAEGILTGDGIGYTVETYVGATRSLGRFNLSIQLGGRYAMVKEMTGKLEIDGQEAGGGPLAMEFNLSGVILQASIGLPL